MSDVDKPAQTMPDFEQMSPEAMKELWIDGLHGEALAEDRFRELENRISSLERSKENENRGSRLKKTVLGLGAAAVLGVGMGIIVGANLAHDETQTNTPTLVDDHSSDSNKSKGTQASPIEQVTQVASEVTTTGNSLLSTVRAIESASGSTLTANSRTTEDRLEAVSGQTDDVSLGEATRKYKAKNFDQAVADILGHPELSDNVVISHKWNRYANLESFGEDMPSQQVIEAKMFAIANSPQNARSALNSLDGRPLAAERTESHAEQVAMLEKLLLKEGVKINGNYRLNGAWGNGLVDAQTGEIRVHTYNYTNKRAVRIDIPGKQPWIFTVDSVLETVQGNCLNDQQVVEQPAPTPTPTTTSHEVPPVSTSTPPAETPPPTDNPTLPPNKPRQPVPQPKPTPKPTPTTPPVTPPVTPPTPPQVAPEKVDPNTTPAGVPGHNGGTPDVPGVGPAGQPVRPDGTVGGEVLPPAPAPEPTPAPLPTQPTPPVQPGEVVGTPTEAPQEEAEGSETPAPTTDPNPQG